MTYPQDRQAKRQPTSLLWGRIRFPTFRHRHPRVRAKTKRSFPSFPFALYDLASPSLSSRLFPFSDDFISFSSLSLIFRSRSLEVFLSFQLFFFFWLFFCLDYLVFSLDLLIFLIEIFLLGHISCTLWPITSIFIIARVTACSTENGIVLSTPSQMIQTKRRD